MKEKINLSNLLNLYEGIIRKKVKNKKKVLNFEKYKISNLKDVMNKLNDPINYHIKSYNIFLIREPKYRVIMSLNLTDKIINHFLTEYILIPKLEKRLDIRNIATRKNMGSDYGIKLAKKYIEANKKYDIFYILKIDIKKYFYTIDHEILKKMLIKELNSDEYQIISNIIDSTNESYVNKTIEKLRKDNLDIPIYEYGKGLPIGGNLSPLLSNIMLNELDHFIVHDLHIKHYIRYMDDFILMHPDKNYLEYVLKVIRKKLKEEYKININEKKTKITNSKEGFIFIGYRFFVKNKKTVVLIRNETKTKIKKKVRSLHYLYNYNYINFETYFSSLSNYLFSFKYGNRKKIKDIIKRYC